MRRFITFVLGTFLTLACLAQERTITGRITDFNNRPLVEVKVWYKSDSDFAFSDPDGIYEISVPEGYDSLFYSKTGYFQDKIAVDENNEINIRLEIEQIYDLSFEDLLNTKVSTVSLGEQNIADAPGVVRVITHDELNRLGIRTIKEALTLVPGFSLMQNDDEQIFSVRGIFATTNQKILVMRDGHSLNEANLDIPQIEYSLSVNSIEKIEIIRGPGASIYGNSAMASVINIITRNKANTEAKLSVGNYGQFDFDFYTGKKISEKSNILIFGRYANIKGQEFPVSYQVNGQSFKGKYVSGHYPENYDIGFRYRNNSYSASFSTRRHEYTTYWTARGLYTHTDSLLARPGLLMNTVHINFAYEPKLNKNLTLHLVHFIDNGKLNNSRLLSPVDSIKYLRGRSQLNEWNASKFGNNYFTRWNYSRGGQMLGGFSFERRNYNSSWLASNTSDSSKISYSEKPFYPEGHEIRAALYIQAQQELYSWLKIDLGMRYDMAQKFKSSLNPRIALIALPFKMLSLKLIYTEAFQAPGYSYRTSNADYSGSINGLQPEKLTTYQASARYMNKPLSYIEITSFYNRLRNLITRIDNNYYANYGKIGSYGIELDIKQNITPFTFFFNYSLLLPDTVFTDESFNKINVHKNEFCHFPKHTVNAGIHFNYKKLIDLSLFGQYASGFRSIQQYEVDDRLILNSGIGIKLAKRFILRFNVNNLFDKYYKLGDPSVIPVEQPGRWWNFSLMYEI